MRWLMFVAWVAGRWRCVGLSPVGLIFPGTVPAFIPMGAIVSAVRGSPKVSLFATFVALEVLRGALAWGVRPEAKYTLSVLLAVPWFISAIKSAVALVVSVILRVSTLEASDIVPAIKSVVGAVALIIPAV